MSGEATRERRSSDCNAIQIHISYVFKLLMTSQLSSQSHSTPKLRKFARTLALSTTLRHVDSNKITVLGSSISQLRNNGRIQFSVVSLRIN